MNSKRDDIPGWVIFLLFCTGLWPFALASIFMNSTGISAELIRSIRGGIRRGGRRGYRQGQTPPFAEEGAPIYTGQGGQPTYARRGGKNSRIKPKSTALGSLLTVGGAAMSFIFLLGLVDEVSSFGLTYVSDWFPLLGFFCAGLFACVSGVKMTRKQKRLRLYMGVIGNRQSVFLDDLAAAAGVPKRKVRLDLQDFLADGTLPTGYIDRATDRLILTDRGYEPPEAQAKTEEKPSAEEKTAEEKRDDDILRQIKEVNDAIPDEVMSRKIDRIGEITSKILDYQRRNPNQSGELRQFLNYYLPTTLKILQAYAQLEAQGVEGENITAAKERIEQMMDKVVEGFEKQLDLLFKADAMDITTDVEVLERMLDKDGLGSGMTMGG